MVARKQCALDFCSTTIICFIVIAGHPESSLLFFPYSPVVNYVNHRQPDSNAKLQWSSLPNHSKEWLSSTPDDLDAEEHAGLIMEMVATRDIEAGEEVFLSYGESWDSAWKDFEKEWKPEEEDLNYTYSTQLNERMEWLRTEEERESDPYTRRDEDIITICFIGDFVEIEESQEDDRIETFQWASNEYLLATSEFAYPCKIMECEEEDEELDHAFDRKDSVQPALLRYTAIVDRGKESEIARVKGIPRYAVQFHDERYTSDLFLRSAFRHEIELPDEMVPKAWRDIGPE
jgi:hypothetical protein